MIIMGLLKKYNCIGVQYINKYYYRFEQAIVLSNVEGRGGGVKFTSKGYVKLKTTVRNSSQQEIKKTI